MLHDSITGKATSISEPIHLANTLYNEIAHAIPSDNQHVTTKFRLLLEGK